MNNDIEKWLVERRKSIGASEVAAVLGMSPFEDALGVYEKKVTDYRIPDNKNMACGRLAEADIAYLYEQETGRPVEDPGDTTITVSKIYPFISATLDRKTLQTEATPGPVGATGPGALELKDVNPRYYPLWVPCDVVHLNPSVWIPSRDPSLEWRDNPPMWHQAQLQMQVYVSEFSWGSLAGKFPGRELRYRDFLANQNFIDFAIPKLIEFWNRVVRRDPPAPTLPSCVEVCKRLYPKSNGETINITGEFEEKVSRWNEIKKIERDSKKERELIESELRLKMAENEFGAMPDGRFLKATTIEKKARTTHFKASSYRTLKIVKNR